MSPKHCLVYVLAAFLLCGPGLAQSADTGSKPAPAGDTAGPADVDKGAAPKARVLKGGALKKDSPTAAGDSAPAGDGENGDEKASAASGKDSASSFKIEGDTVSLKSGKQLRGVKVLRITPSMVELEYVPGQPAMKLPRKLVTDIKYGNPADAPAAAPGPEKPDGGDVRVAEEVSAEFNRKMTAPLPGTPLEFKDQDALAVLKDLADRAQIVVTVTPEAQQVPEAQRKITLTVAPSATLSTVLREEFRKSVPALKFSTQFDKVVVTSTEAEALKAAGSLPPGLAPKNGAAPK